MSEELIIRHCSPTLAGLKTGNMFACDFQCKLEMYEAIRHWNRVLSEKGLCMMPLRYNHGHALLYLFRPARLADDLKNNETVRLLAEHGYPTATSGKALAWLRKRFNDSDGFPHEVGLFLSYPPEDVRGFIENKAANYKCVGTWKVYGDADMARRTFQRYRKCTEVYCRDYYNKGVSIEKLAVAG